MIRGDRHNKSTTADWWTIIMYLLFAFMGWLNIYAASFDLESAIGIFDLAGRSGMQMVWIGTSLILAFVLLKIDSNFYETYAYLFYLFGIVLLIITLIVAPDIKGSRSWLVMGPIRLQPAEFMKFLVALALAKTLSVYNFKLMKPLNLLLVSSIILIPTLIVILQSETGTALVYLSLVFVLYREGLPGGILFMGVSAIIYFVFTIKYSETELGLFSVGEIITIATIIFFTAGLVRRYLKRKDVPAIILGIGLTVAGIGYVLFKAGHVINVGLFAAIALGVVLLYLLYLALRYRRKQYFYIFLFAIGSFVFMESSEYVFTDILQPHQRMRIKVTLGMEKDLQGAGYHVDQSKIAIGSGGSLGKGYLNGTQTKLKYVPEQDTDFIFCTVGEEWGFVGSIAVLFLFLIFILRLIYLAERQSSTFARTYGYGVVSVFIFHLMVNIGMVVGIMPVIGIPLPFFSYGGSSMWGFTLLLFIFLSLDKARKR